MEAIVIMGSVLEVGKLVAAVWLHKNWGTAFKFLRAYLLAAVIVLSGITSMGIFGFLSKSHVEHSASVDKEQAIVAQIESKIERENSLILRLEDKLSKLESKQGSSTDVKDETLTRLESRVTQIKEESETSLIRQRELIESYQSRLKELDQTLESSKESGLFASNKKYKDLLESQKEERNLLSTRKLEAESKIQSIIDKTDQDISKTREQIDNISLQKDEVIVSTDNTEIEQTRAEVEASYDKIDQLETEKFDYGAKLRALEVEIGPVKYIASVLQDWIGLEVDISEAVRIVIVILIFVFDPLAILLLIAATITYSSMKEKELPADVKEIRNKLLEELEEYLDEGGIADHFIDRNKK
tara:strand:+ start:101 stop:1171 length:1071 start_codon:yes stop_codon:yes gene_type:complete